MMDATDWQARWQALSEEYEPAEDEPTVREALGLPEDEEQWSEAQHRAAVERVLQQMEARQPGRRWRDVRGWGGPGFTRRAANCRYALEPHGTGFGWGAEDAATEELAANVLAEFGLTADEALALCEGFAADVLAEKEGTEIRVTLRETVAWLEEQEAFDGFGPVAWELKTEPATYLQRHPDGQHAVDARAARWRGVAGGGEEEEEPRNTTEPEEETAAEE